MLSSVLKTEKANIVSVNIMRAFVAMRHIIKNSIDYQKELFIMQNKLLEHDNKFIEYDSKFDNKDGIDNLINKGENKCKRN